MDEGQLFAFLDVLPIPSFVLDTPERDSSARIAFSNAALSKRWKDFRGVLSERGRCSLERIGRRRELHGADEGFEPSEVELEFQNKRMTNWRVSRANGMSILSLTFSESHNKPGLVSATLSFPPLLSPPLSLHEDDDISLPCPPDDHVINADVPAWVNALPSGIFKTDVDYQLTYVNAAFRHEIGLDHDTDWRQDNTSNVPIPSEEDLAGRIFPDDVELLVEFRERLITTQTPQEIEFRWDMKGGGGNAWAYVRVVPQRENGVVVGFNGIISSRTISMLKLSAQKSEEDQAQLESLALLSEYSAVGLATVSLEGEVMTVNDSWRRIVQLAEGEEPKDWVNRVLESELEDVIEHWKSAMTSKSNFTRRIRTKHGIVCFVLVVMNHQQTGYLGSVVDVTQQWLTEQRLITLSAETAAAQETRIVDALRQKREQEMLVDFVSHEIRTPTSVILQGANLTKDFLVELKQLESSLSPSTLESLEEAIETQDGLIDCALSQTRIANDILGLAAISLKRYEISACEVDLISCTQKLLAGFKNQCRLASISLKLDIGASLAALGSHHILLDPVRMSQIINNLLSNAIRFTTGRPSPRIITLKVDVSTNSAPTTPQPENFLASSPVFVQLAVSDTGVGMSEGEKTKLFQYCSQASPLTHLRFGGSGLGLWIVKQLVELMGGSVGVDSTLDVGTTFRCSLAATIADEQEKTAFPPDVASECNGSPLTVLVVEDNHLSQRLLKRQLERAGHYVDTANDGLAGLEAISKRLYDVVIMDVEMPLCDGLEATRRIRLEEARTKSSKLRVVGLTGNARSTQIEAALASGMSAVTTKPYNMSSLLSQLRS